MTAEDLNLDPALLGRALARPGRRAAAITIDALCVGAFNALGNAWVVLALAGLLLAQHLLRQRAARRPAWAAAPAAAARAWRAVVLAALLLGLGALTQDAADERRPAAREAATGADLDGDSAAAASAPASAARRGQLQALRARVQAQENELHRLRAAGLDAWQARAEYWRDELGQGWVWSLLYFTLLPAGWLGGRPGQTLGKRLLGLQVAELTGKPMTPLRNLKRYGGYAAGMATGGLGLLQLLWDSNRQAIQDKTAHTVVLDLHPPRTAPAAGL